MSKLIDIEKLYRAYSIPYNTHGSKHCRPGWVQTACPFCSGSEGDHLGYNLNNGYFNCWRCGFHPTEKTLAVLLHVSFLQIKEIIEKYSSLRRKTRVYAGKQREYAPLLKLPVGCTSLSREGRLYLKNRKFNARKLEQVWDLKQTQYYGDYKFRIIAPITYHGKLVSYQGRDITNKSLMKYKACAIHNEVIHHKHIVYGYDQADLFGNIPIVVEGITDVWRLGPGAVATFGTQYTMAQVKSIRELFYNAYRVFIIFDGEPQAQLQAKKLKASLNLALMNVELYQIDGDPGGLSQKDADHLLKNLNKKIFAF